MLRPFLVSCECHEAHRACCEEAVYHGPVSHSVRGKSQGEKKTRYRRGKCHKPHPIDWRTSLHPGNLFQLSIGPECPEDPDWHVNVEECSPIKENKEHTAQGQPGHGSKPESAHVQAQGESEFLRWCCVHNHGNAICEEYARPKPLQTPKQDHQIGLIREADQRGAYCKDREATGVYLHSST